MTVSSRRAFGYVMCTEHAVKLRQHKSDSLLFTANKNNDTNLNLKELILISIFDSQFRIFMIKIKISYNVAMLYKNSVLIPQNTTKL